MADRKNPAAVAEAGADVEEAWALHLRLNGYTVRQMAARSEDDLGRRLSSTTVQRRLDAARAELREARLRMAGEERDIEIAKLDEAERRHLAYFAECYYLDPETQEKKLDEKRALPVEASLARIRDQRSKLLGLDAAVKVDVSGTVEHVDGVSAELARLVAEADQRAEQIKATA
jgi:hypothetical protein